jgi:oligopeptide/dipeptide ABC transporter ATP-binding protein
VKIQSGQVLLEGEDILQKSTREMCDIRGRRIAMIYQNPMSSLNPVLTIGAQLAEAMTIHGRVSKAAARRRSGELLGEVGIPNPLRVMDSFPYQLSGGMRQRVVIAMALSCEPALIVADEPTTALDVTTQARVLALLHQMVDSLGAAVILITHDLEVAAEFCEEIHVMYAGRIVERAESVTLFRSPRHPYTNALLDSTCDLTTEVSKPIPVIAGQPPQPGDIPPGCAFASRCASVQPQCLDSDPPLVSEDGFTVACWYPVPVVPTTGTNDIRSEAQR